MQVLVTGFEPFGGDAINPSALLAAQLGGSAIAGAAVAHEILPCAFAPLQARLHHIIAAHRPDLVIAFGLATGRAGISLERVAINVIDARIPDNEGDSPIDQPVVTDGPAAYFTTLPIKAAMTELQASSLPTEISQTAGTYVCNATFYGLMHLAATSFPGLRAGFVHLPCLPDMPAARAGVPSLAMQDMHRAGRMIIEACLACNTDRRIAAGAVA
jgi:pyroglutamyl-peptidase